MRYPEWYKGKRFGKNKNYSTSNCIAKKTGLNSFSSDSNYVLETPLDQVMGDEKGKSVHTSSSSTTIPDDML